MGQWLPGKHICVVGTARPEQRNPIYLTHELIVLILVVERETGVIVGCDINMVCSLTREFIKSYLRGKIWFVTSRRFGSASRKIILALQPRPW